MSSSVKGGITALDNSAPIGDHGFSPLDDASKAARTPRFLGSPIASYEVPADKRFKLRCLLLTHHPAVYYGTIGTGRAFKCELLQDGSPVAEFYPQTMGWGNPAGYNSTVQGSCARLGYGLLAHGLTLVEGATLAIRITPTTATRYVKAVGWLHGRDAAGKLVPLLGRFDGAGAGPFTILEYTVPAGGFSLISYGVEAQMQALTLSGYLSPMMGGLTVFDSIVQSEPTAKNTDFFLAIPFHGLSLAEGTEIRAEAADIHQSGNVYGMAVFGDEETVGGAVPTEIVVGCRVRYVSQTIWKDWETCNILLGTVLTVDTGADRATVLWDDNALNTPSDRDRPHWDPDVDNPRLGALVRVS